MVTLRYTYNVSWSPEDNEWVGTCDEFPGLSLLDEDKTKALRGIEWLVLQTVDDIRSA